MKVSIIILAILLTNLFACQKMELKTTNKYKSSNSICEIISNQDISTKSETNISDNNVNDNSVNITELDLTQKYNIGGVEFHFDDFDFYGRTIGKKMVFTNVEYEYNNYQIVEPVLRLSINGNNNYILWTHGWDNDVRVSEILELKNGKINVYWLTAGTCGELIAYDDSTLTFKEAIATDLENSGADIISSYEIREDEIKQIGDYKIENCGYILIGHNLPAHIIFEGEDREILILKGEKIKFTHSDFESKLYFKNENGVDGYLVVSRDDEYEMLWILSELKVNGVILDEYFQGRIDDLARLGYQSGKKKTRSKLICVV